MSYGRKFLNLSIRSAFKTITVKSDSAEGTIETTMEGESFVQHIKMKRIGDCNK